jgi:hypothetical protein
MSFVKGLTLGFLLCSVALCFISPTAPLAQNNRPAESAEGDRDQTLKQLLVEVHELRSYGAWSETTKISLSAISRFA